MEEDIWKAQVAGESARYLRMPTNPSEGKATPKYRPMRRKLPTENSKVQEKRGAACENTEDATQAWGLHTCSPNTWEAEGALMQI